MIFVKSLSIVIPALNERENLPHAIRAAQTAFPHAEILVIDGGSSDGTPEWVAAQPELLLLRAPVRGRGPQMNTGAKAATGTLLLFLHADCVLPPDAAEQIAAVKNGSSTFAGGAFCVRFAETTPWSLPFTAWLINAQSRLRRTATGDQAIFVLRENWAKIGGFPDWPLFEDVDFVTRLKANCGRFVIVPAAVTISARRWQEFGVGRTSLLMVGLWIAYYLGVSPYRLKQWFTDVRPHLTQKSRKL